MEKCISCNNGEKKCLHYFFQLQEEMTQLKKLSTLKIT